MHTLSRSVSDDALLIDIEYKKRKLLSIIEVCTSEIETENGHSVMVEPRSAIAAIAEANRMDGEYEKDNAQQREAFFLNINLAGHGA